MAFQLQCKRSLILILTYASERERRMQVRWGLIGLLLLSAALFGCDPEETAEVPTLFVPATWTPSPTRTDLPTQEVISQATIPTEATEVSGRPSSTPLPLGTSELAQLGTDTDTPSPTDTLLPSETPTDIRSATPTNSPTATVTSLPTLIIGTVVFEGEGSLVREGPGFEFATVGFNPGEPYEVLARTINYQGQTWYQVRSAASLVGWLPAEGILLSAEAFVPDLQIETLVSPTPTYTATFTITPTYTLTPSITPAPTETETPTATATVTNTVTDTPTFTPSPTLPPDSNARIESDRPVNLRVGPDTTYRILQTLNNGNALTVIGRDERANWFLVRTYDPGSQLGWVPADFVATLETNLPLAWFGFESDDNSTVECALRINPIEEATWSNLPPGLPWVVVPFLNEGETLSESFLSYDSVVASYGALGIRVIFALTPDTFRDEGDYDWDNMTSDTWTAFVEEYAATVERIVQHFGAGVSGYLVWQPTQEGADGLAGAELPTNVYAELVDLVIDVIRAYQRDSTIVLGGIEDPGMLLLVRQIVGGTLNFDALALSLAGNEDNPGEVLASFRASTPDTSLWLTDFPLEDDNQEALQNIIENLRIFQPEAADTLVLAPWTGALVTEQGQQTELYSTFTSLCVGR
jgi:hypothetical protein